MIESFFDHGRACLGKAHPSIVSNHTRTTLACFICIVEFTTLTLNRLAASVVRFLFPPDDIMPFLIKRSLQVPRFQSLTDGAHPTRATPLRHLICQCFFQGALGYARVIKVAETATHTRSPIATLFGHAPLPWREC